MLRLLGLGEESYCVGGSQSREPFTRRKSTTRKSLTQGEHAGELNEKTERWGMKSWGSERPRPFLRAWGQLFGTYDCLLSIRSAGVGRTWKEIENSTCRRGLEIEKASALSGKRKSSYHASSRRFLRTMCHIKLWSMFLMATLTFCSSEL